ncbi:MAG: hypothetical protein ACRD10_14365, partial [Terriglobia bacterium]
QYVSLGKATSRYFGKTGALDTKIHRLFVGVPNIPSSHIPGVKTQFTTTHTGNAAILEYRVQ